MPRESLYTVDGESDAEAETAQAVLSAMMLKKNE